MTFVTIKVPNSFARNLIEKKFDLCHNQLLSFAQENANQINEISRTIVNPLNLSYCANDLFQIIILMAVMLLATPWEFSTKTNILDFHRLIFNSTGAQLEDTNNDEYFLIKLIPTVWANGNAESIKLFDGEAFVLDLNIIALCAFSCGRLTLKVISLIYQLSKVVKPITVLPFENDTWFVEQDEGFYNLKKTIQTDDHDLPLLTELNQTVSLIKEHFLTEERYFWYKELLCLAEDPTVLTAFKELTEYVKVRNYLPLNTESNSRLMNLLVAFLGHDNKEVREKATGLLTEFVNGHDWQDEVPLLPQIVRIGQELHITIEIFHKHDAKTNPAGPQNYICILYLPNYEQNEACDSYRFQYLPLRFVPVQTDLFNKSYESKRVKNEVLYKWKCELKLEAFKHCGIYDYKVIRYSHKLKKYIDATHPIDDKSYGYGSSFSIASFDENNEEIIFNEENKVLAMLNSIVRTKKTTTVPIQGRYICHPANLSTNMLAEVSVDSFPTSKLNGYSFDDTYSTFYDVATSVKALADYKIKGLFLNSCMMRDNGNQLPDGSYERPFASPYAITSRANAATILGGEKGFENLSNSCKKNNVRIFINAPMRISRVRANRCYSKQILRYIGEDHLDHPLAGAPGRALKPFETVHLNYRDIDVWEMFISDITWWIKRFNIDGVKIENAIDLPIYYPIDKNELSRRDSDYTYHYSLDERFNGAIVKCVNSVNDGYYNTQFYELLYGNPLLIYTCKRLWSVKSTLAIFGDCGVIESTQYERVGSICRSGLIPFICQNDKMLCNVLGKDLTFCGKVQSCVKANTRQLNDYYNEIHANLPANALIIQNAVTPNSPLFTELFRGALLPALNYHYLCSDIPCAPIEEYLECRKRREISFYFSNNVNQATCFCGTNSCVLKTAEANNNHQSFVLPASCFDNREIRLDSDLGIVWDNKDITLRQYYSHLRHLITRFPVFRTSLLIPIRANDKKGNPLYDVFAFCRINSKCEIVLGAINFSNSVCHDCCISLKFVKSLVRAISVPSTTVCEIWDLERVRNKFDNTSLSLEMVKNGTIELLDAGLVSMVSLPQLLSLQHTTYLDAYGSKLIGIKFLTLNHNDIHTEFALYISSIQHAKDLIERCRNERLKRSSIPLTYLRRAVSANYVLSKLSRAVTNFKQPEGVLKIITNIVLANSLSVLEAKRRDVLPISFDLYDALTACNAFENDENLTSTFIALIEFLKEQLQHALKDNESDKPGFSKSTSYSSTIVSGAQSFDFIKDSKSTTDDGKCEDNDEEQAAEQKSDDKLDAIGGKQKIRYKTLLELLDSKFTSLLKRHNIGDIVFISPEFGKFCTIGGLGVMLSDLTDRIRNYLKFPVTVMLPYYHIGRDKKPDYLAKFGVKYIGNVNVKVGSEELVFGLHEGYDRNMRILFVHNESVFPEAYPNNNSQQQVRFLSCFGKVFLEVLCQLKCIPKIIVTNDWPTGFIAAYAKLGHFGDVFRRTMFFHIIHNLDWRYEGRVYTTPDRTFDEIHCLPRDYVIDPHWIDTIINPSRTAILCTDNWGTVSPGYLNELLGLNPRVAASPLAPVLRIADKPFSTCNGIPVEIRERELAELGLTREQAKAKLQEKYFNMTNPDLSMPIYSFIGRITEQKGVLMILEVFERVLQHHNFKLQLLIGGMVTWNDPYSAHCGSVMLEFKSRYPHNFYADPDTFFTDGKLVNLGSDYSLMPSTFEPGGIVQHEFMVAGTPVIAHNTGGLGCTVFEYDNETKTGNGFVFDSFTNSDLIHAWERSYKLYLDAENTRIIRENAKKSVISSNQCASEWTAEFHRVTERIYAPRYQVELIKQQLKSATVDFGELSYILANANFPIFHHKPSSRCLKGTMNYLIHYKFSNSARKVFVIGSYDNWTSRTELRFNNEKGRFETELNLAVGTYYFKFIVDGQWLCSPSYQIVKSVDGIENNCITIQS